MSDCWNEECKDREPKDTILICKDFLEKVGLDHEIIRGKSNIVKSVKIISQDSIISSEGKGITYDYACASAYGELLERLLNFAYFRMNSNVLKENIDSNAIFCNFDEEKVRIFVENFLQTFFHEHINSMKELLFYLSNLNVNELYLCTKFTSEVGTNYFIPCDYLDILYGTNGMCAGNTREEALVQGISEIIERYTISQIIEQKIELINVTKDARDNYESINKYVNTLEKDKAIKIVICQCVQKIRIPVFVLLYLNKKSGTYFVKVGVHLKHRIAIERCFTELFQGKEEKNLFGQSYIYNCNEFSQRNKEQIYRDGRGNYPFYVIETLGKKEERIRENNSTFSSNLKILDYYTKEIKKLGYSILISNREIKKFFSYQVIIPGMSETISLEHFIHNIPKYTQSIRLEKLIKKIYIRTITYTELIELYHLLELYNSNLFIPLSLIIKRRCNFETEKLKNVYLIDVLVYCLSTLNKKKELVKLIVYLLNSASSDKGKRENMRIEYYACVLSCLKYDNNEVLSYVYNQKLINKVKKDIGNHFVDNCKIRFCDKCNQYSSRECVNKKEIDLINNILKEINRC